MSRFVFASWLAFTLVACEASEDPGQEEDAPPGLTQAECDGASELLCAAACTCGCELTGPGAAQSFADEAACLAALSASCDGSRGTEDQGGECNGDVVKTVAAYSCGAPLEFPASCDEFFSE